MKGTQTRLYNVFFPVWMLILLPQIWLIAAPLNFAVDSLVLWLAIRAQRVEPGWAFYKSHIWKVFLLGFLADLLAALPILGGVMLNLGGAMADSPLITVPGVLLAGVLLYLFDFHVSFRDCEKPLRRKLALIFAIATAPYTFLIPSSWIYHF